MSNTSPAGALSWKTRIAYGLGDTAQNVVWGAMGILTFFYTDYAGIDPAIVGLVMLLSRCFDGFSDIIMGFIVEKTNSKWGKSRPWILWMSLPFALSIVLIYTVPQTTPVLQFAYIFVTYNLCTTFCYTALNLPYGSLSAMMTRVSEERDMLSITRMCLSPWGRILSVSATLPLVKVFGDSQMAWVGVMSVWAAVGLALLLFCFRNCKETVVIEARKKAEKIPVKKALKGIATNKYFWVGTTIWMMQNVIFTVTGTITIDGLEMNRGNLADIRRRLGYVLQDSDNQMFMPTVFEDMLFGPLNYGMPRPEAEALVDRTLAELNLTHLKNRRNHKLSGGEKRMAAIATILAMQPKIMLMDEPSTALDPKNRRTLIRTLNALPVTKIIATHDLDLVLETCDRVLLLHDGQIAADGPAGEILRDRALLERHSLELPFCLAGVPERAKKS